MNVDSNFTLLLSGTPIENKVEDLYNILQIVDPVFGKIYNTLSRITKDQNILAIETRKIIDGIYLSRMKTKKELPVKLNIEEVFIDMNKSETLVHKKIIQHFGNDKIKTNAKKDLQYYNDYIIALMRLRQTASYCYQLKGLDFLKNIKIEKESSKEKKLLELTKTSKEKWIIFTQFNATLNRLKTILPNSVSISGTTPNSQRGEIIEKFQNDDTKFIIVSLKAGNSGITLHSANNIIMYDLWWNPAIMQQAIARAYRIGQTKDVKCYMFANKKSIDENILKIVNIKKEIIDGFNKTNTNNTTLESKENNTNVINELINKVF